MLKNNKVKGLRPRGNTMTKQIKVKHIRDPYADLYSMTKAQLIAIIKDCDAAINLKRKAGR